MLFVIGKKDEIVPYQQTVQLYKAAKNARFKNKYVERGGTHNDTWMVDLDRYIFTINDFMNKANTEMSNYRKNPNGEKEEKEQKKQNSNENVEASTSADSTSHDEF